MFTMLITLRVDGPVHSEWVRAAKLRGMSLSEWIRVQCNDKITTPASGKRGKVQ